MVVVEGAAGVAAAVVVVVSSFLPSVAAWLLKTQYPSDDAPCEYEGAIHMHYTEGRLQDSAAK